MEIFGYIMMGFIFVCLLGGFIGMFTVNSDPMTDQQLYGMDAEDYSRKMMGEEEYKKYIDFYKNKTR